MRICLGILAILFFGYTGIAQGSPALARDTKGHITRAQAAEIADAYFQKEMGSCGGVSDEAILKNGYWLFSFQEGYGGTNGKYPIAVSITTGSVGCHGYPLISDPTPLLQKNAVH